MTLKDGTTVMFHSPDVLMKSEEGEQLFCAYGHTDKGKSIIKEVYATSSADALDKARKQYINCRFNHVNIKLNIQ